METKKQNRKIRYCVLEHQIKMQTQARGRFYLSSARKMPYRVQVKVESCKLQENKWQIYAQN